MLYQSHSRTIRFPPWVVQTKKLSVTGLKKSGTLIVLNQWSVGHILDGWAAGGWMK